MDIEDEFDSVKAYWILIDRIYTESYIVPEIVIELNKGLKITGDFLLITENNRVNEGNS
ncbi:MAG: hypothetical protein ACOCQW_01165 [Halanaerobiaceae bacterium]